MAYRLLLILSLGIALGAACKRKTTPESAPSTSDSTASSPTVAVLTLEEIADRAPGGLALHTYQIDRLVALLRQNGVDAHHLLIGADRTEPDIPTQFDAAVLIDTPELRAGELHMLDSFVREGGRLLIIGPVGPAARLAGVQPLSDEPRERTGRSRVARPGPPLPPTQNSEFDWGPAARMAWPVRADGATVLMEDPDGAPVLTEHRLGAGVVWYSAILPPSRMFDGWTGAESSATLYASLLQTAPARRRPPRAGPLELTLSVNQIAYGEDGWPVVAILRARGGDATTPLTGLFEARRTDGSVALRGELTPIQPRWRSRLAVADLSELPAGEFTLIVSLNSGETISADVRRDRSHLENYLLRELAAWLDSLDFRIPVDAAAAQPQAVEHRALLAWSLARAIETGKAPERYRWDIERLGYWLRDAAPRLVRDPNAPPSTLAAIAGGLARSLAPLREQVSLQLSRELQVVAEQAQAALVARRLDDTPSIGQRLWAAAELYRATFIREYRTEAENAARLLFGRQIGPGHSVEGDLYGEFFADALLSQLLPPDATRSAAALAILGIIRLEGAIEPGPFKDDLNVVLNRYIRGVLLAGAAMNPYGGLPAGIEAVGPQRPRPDNRGFLPPEKIRARTYPSDHESIAPGAEAVRLLFAVVLLERASAAGDPALAKIACQQVNHLLGLNPENRLLWSHRRVLQGLIGRGPEGVPVWRPPYSESGSDLPGNAWLLALHALLRESI